jgi:glutamyl-tRNA synthetase
MNVNYFQIDSWVDFSATLLSDNNKFKSALLHLDKQLSPVTYLVGQSITLADFAVWGALKGMVLVTYSNRKEPSRTERAIQCKILLYC